MMPPFKHHKIEQNTEEWLQLRVGLPTASMMSVVMAHADKQNKDGSAKFGDPALRYACELAIQRITRVPAPEGFKSFDMMRGHEEEPVAAQLYENSNFCKVYDGGFFENGLFGDSPDRLIDEDGALEIKSVTVAVQLENMRRGAPDPAYWWQLIGHLLATGRDWVDFASYCSQFPVGKQLIAYRVERKDVQKDIDALESRLIAFNALIEENRKFIEGYANYA